MGQANFNIQAIVSGSFEGALLDSGDLNLTGNSEKDIALYNVENEENAVILDDTEIAFDYTSESPVRVSGYSTPNAPDSIDDALYFVAENRDLLTGGNVFDVTGTVYIETYPDQLELVGLGSNDTLELNADYILEQEVNFVGFEEVKIYVTSDIDSQTIDEIVEYFDETNGLVDTFVEPTNEYSFL